MAVNGTFSVKNMVRLLIFWQLLVAGFFPPGFMPDLRDGVPTIVICTPSGTTEIPDPFADPDQEPVDGNHCSYGTPNAAAMLPELGLPELAGTRAVTDIELSDQNLLASAARRPFSARAPPLVL